MRVRTAVTLVFLLSIAAGCAHRASTTPPVGHGGLQVRQSGFFSAVSARDAQGTAAFFAEDAVLHVANMPPIEGRPAIRRFYENVFRFLSASDAASEQILISESGDMGYARGSTANSFESPTGVTEYRGKFVLVWTRQRGEWFIVHYGISSDEPANPGEE